VGFRPETTTSERQLALALAATGRATSLDELSTWRKDGLLPPLASKGLGASRGKTYYWREVNILQQAQAAYDAMRRHGRTDHALVTLFLSGFAVPPGQLRRAWQHRANLRRPPFIRIAREKGGAGALVDKAVDSLLLQAALCIGAAIETDDDPQRTAIIALLNRALPKLGLARHATNDSVMPDRLYHLLNIIGSILATSDLVREASDDDLRQAQCHLAIAMTFLRDCGSPSEQVTETLGRHLFLFLLTLLRSGQIRTLDRIMACLEGAGWQAVGPPAQTRALPG
jgi:hypothetical protein